MAASWAVVGPSAAYRPAVVGPSAAWRPAVVGMALAQHGIELVLHLVLHLGELHLQLVLQHGPSTALFWGDSKCRGLGWTRGRCRKSLDETRHLAPSDRHRPSAFAVGMPPRFLICARPDTAGGRAHCRAHCCWHRQPCPAQYIRRNKMKTYCQGAVGQDAVGQGNVGQGDAGERTVGPGGVGERAVGLQAVDQGSVAL